MEMGIELLAGGLRSVGVPQSYGPAIIAFTLGALRRHCREGLPSSRGSAEADLRLLSSQVALQSTLWVARMPSGSCVGHLG